MEAYARALRQLPTIIADNGGYDGSELISGLRAAHAKGQKASASSVFFFFFSRVRTRWSQKKILCRRWILYTMSTSHRVIYVTAQDA